MTTAPNLIREQLLALAAKWDALKGDYHYVRGEHCANELRHVLRSLAAEPVDTGASGREAVGWISPHALSVLRDPSNENYSVYAQIHDTRSLEASNSRSAENTIPVFLHPPAADVVYQLKVKNLRDSSWYDVSHADYERALTEPSLLETRRLIVHPDDIRTVTQEGLSHE